MPLRVADLAEAQESVPRTSPQLLLKPRARNVTGKSTTDADEEHENNKREARVLSIRLGVCTGIDNSDREGFRKQAVYLTCQNPAAKGSLVCTTHKDVQRTFRVAHATKKKLTFAGMTPAKQQVGNFM